MRKAPIYVFLEGGLVTAVCTQDGEDRLVMIIDYDVEGSTECIKVKQTDGSLEEAHLSVLSLESLGVDLIIPE